MKLSVIPLYYSHFRAEESKFDPVAESQMDWLKEVIVAVRNIRAECNISPSHALELLLRSIFRETKICLENNRTLLQSMAKLSTITLLDANEEPPLSVTKLVENNKFLSQWRVLLIKSKNSQD